MWKKVSFKDYLFRDKVCISALMGCIALCGVIAADRYMKNDMKGACAGTLGMGIGTFTAAKYTSASRKRARHKMYRKREYD